MSPTKKPIMDEQSSFCPRCGTPLSSEGCNVPCPVCLLQLGLESWEDSAADDPASTPTEAARDRFSAPELAELQPHFPGFKLLSLLGKGGMGAVYLATQNTLDRQVALKIIRPESAADTDFAERFAREARSLARLSHPNILQRRAKTGLFQSTLRLTRSVGEHRGQQIRHPHPDRAQDVAVVGAVGSAASECR